LNGTLRFPAAMKTATVLGKDLGEIGPLSAQENLADIWIPQSGRFFVGDVYLEAFEPERHLSIFSASKTS